MAGIVEQHPWDAICDQVMTTVGNTCDIWYDSHSTFWIKQGYEWSLEHNTWMKDGKPLWFCQCWRRYKK